MTSGMNYFMGRTIEKRREPSGLELTRGEGELFHWPTESRGVEEAEGVRREIHRKV